MTDLFCKAGMMVGSVCGVVSVLPMRTIELEPVE
jgi:hypothetical protein